MMQNLTLPFFDPSADGKLSDLVIAAMSAGATSSNIVGSTDSFMLSDVPDDHAVTITELMAPPSPKKVKADPEA